MAKAATAELQAQMLTALQALAPATDAVPIVANDNSDLAQEAVGLACGGNAGAVKLKTAAGNDRTIAIASGQTIAIRFRKVYLTGTSATGLTALLNPAVPSTPKPTPTPAPTPTPTPQPTLSLSSAVTKAEGNSGTTAFTWTLTLNRDGSTAAYPFTWVVTGTGSNPANAADFGGTLPSGSGTFAAGETTKTITVQVSGDTAVEPDEAFTLAVTASGLNTVTSTGTISNDDLPTLSLTPSSASIPANAAAGYQLAAIGNVPSGVTPTLTPNDGRFLIAGSAGTGWVVVLGNAAISAGKVDIAVSAAGATGATFALTITAGAGAGLTAPPNWDFIAYGDSRVENGLGGALGSGGYAATQSMLGWPSLIPQETNHRLRLGRYPNFGISASNTVSGKEIPRRPATFTLQNQTPAATASTPPTWYRGTDSTNKGLDYAAAHPAGIIMVMHGGADSDLDTGARTRFKAYIDYWRTNAPNKLIVILNEPPFGVNQAGAVVGGSGQSVMDFAAWQKTFDYASGNANATPNVVVVDINALITDPASGPTPYLNKQGFYRDDRHFTPWGAQQVAKAVHARLSAAFGSTYTGLPSQISLPVSNGATIAQDTIGVHPGFVHTNPLLKPGANGQVITPGFTNLPSAANVPEGWAIGGTSAALGADIITTLDKTGTDPDGYPMTTITLSGTLRSATFTGSISGTTLTIEAMDTSKGPGTIVIGSTLYAGSSSYFVQALLSGTANTAGATYQVSAGVAKPSGTPMMTTTAFGVQMFQTAIAGSGSELSLTDKLRPVGRVVLRTGSKLCNGASIQGFARDGSTINAKSQSTIVNSRSQGGSGSDAIGYHLNAYGFDAGGASNPLMGQMIDLADPNMDTANGGPGFLTTKGAIIQVNVDLLNASGFDQPALAVVDVSRVGLARVSS
ncbi:hypothetical protein [uncultured Sphingomonas sp.]|uniref:spike base protein, RCAP_Rcc01079 family n=1 Tax=uncultured Sphingomonas sp. TaxID=158754 RepID=UPI0025E2E71A|nr:hypothetical protein [uncultured Sphingomonas sp.]